MKTPQVPALAGMTPLGIKPRPTGHLFTEAEARKLAAEDKDWFARRSRVKPGMWVVWSEAGDHYVEFG